MVHAVVHIQQFLNKRSLRYQPFGPWNHFPDEIFDQWNLTQIRRRVPQALVMTQVMRMAPHALTILARTTHRCPYISPFSV